MTGRIRTGRFAPPPNRAPRLDVAQARAALASRLRARLEELEATTLARVYAVSAPAETTDPAYLQALRASLTTALEYALVAIELGEGRTPAPPPSLLAQARMAARNGVGLDTVLRRYFTGYSLLVEFVLEEAEDGGLTGGSTLQRVLRGQAAVFDRLIQAVSEEHRREVATRAGSTERRRAERVRRLLAGEPIDATELNYDLDASHLGIVALGPGAAEAAKELAQALDKSLLAVRFDEETLWAWLGSRRGFEPSDLARLGELRTTASREAILAFGEPGEGPRGWRLTHRQAQAALPLAQRSPGGATRYGEAALLSSMLSDDLLIESLHQLYLAPLEAERDGGKAARETLQAYFASERNVSSAAAALGVKRHTVTNRLRSIEKALDRPLSDCALEIEAALRLEDLNALPSPRSSATVDAAGGPLPATLAGHDAP